MKIYHGKIEPLTAMGKHQTNLLMFAYDNPTWHTYKNDKRTINAINGLLKRKSIIINEYNQFKINLA